MRRQEAEQAIKLKIETYGWTLMFVSKQQRQQGPDWAYTIGLLKSFGHPEVVIVGASRDGSAAFLNTVAEQVRDGRRFSPGVRVQSVCEPPFVCAFKSVPSSAAPFFLGAACRYYGDADRFTCLQMFVADRDNCLPWEPGADPESRRWQVDLSLVADAAKFTVGDG